MAAGGVDWNVVLKALRDWTVAGSSLATAKVVWNEQDGARPESPAIVLRVSNISEFGPAWLDIEDNFYVFADILITSVDATANTLTKTAHGLLTGDGPVRISSTGTVPGGLTAGTNYWVVKVDANIFKLASTFQNAMATVPIIIDLTSAGTGTITLADTTTTQRQGQEILQVSRVMLRLSVELRCHADPVPGPEMAIAILQRVRQRREWPSQKAILSDANISLGEVDRIMSVIGTRDDFLVEPRSQMLVHVNIAAEEAEAATIIERALLTNRYPDPDVEFAVPE